MKVLVVDDDASLLDALARTIRRWGGEVDCADNAKDGASLASSSRYDFVLLDLMMPERSGVWFLEHAKLHPMTKVVVMSGFAPTQVVAKVLKLGACDFLEKPFEPEDLMRAFEAHAARGIAA
jgi:DNA-binding response OmpR family regulator